MADNQINARTLAFVEENGLRDRVHFWVDPDSQSIGCVPGSVEIAEKA